MASFLRYHDANEGSKESFNRYEMITIMDIGWLDCGPVPALQPAYHPKRRQDPLVVIIKFW